MPIVEGRYWGARPGVGGRTYDITPTGQRFLMIEEDASNGTAPEQTHLALNWFSELQARVPTGR